MSIRSLRKYNRSGFAICPICGRQAKLQLHHIKGRDIPQANFKHNLVWLCATCHDEETAGELIIIGWRMTTDGRVLEWYRVPLIKGTNTL